MKKTAVFNLNTGHIFVPQKPELYRDEKYVWLEVDSEIEKRIKAQKIGQFEIELLQGKI